jgi:hypothetical protein
MKVNVNPIALLRYISLLSETLRMTRGLIKNNNLIPFFVILREFILSLPK